MQLGKFRIDLLDTGIFKLDGGSMFGVVPKALWAKAYDPGDELNRIPLSARPMLVRWDNHNYLIDTGNGNKWNEKLASIYNIDMEKSSINNALKSFNLTCEDIDTVILTHLHFDHAGGGTKFLNGKAVPSFPNAKYFVQKDHLKWAQSPTEKDRASFFKENFEPLLADGFLHSLDGEGEISPGISVIPVFGHTKAMQMVKITDDNKTLLYCADICPTAAHIPVTYILGYDNNPLISLEEKKKFMNQAYEENWILAFEHDAFVQASTVIRSEKGYAKGEEIVITQ